MLGCVFGENDNNWVGFLWICMWAYDVVQIRVQTRANFVNAVANVNRTA